MFRGRCLWPQPAARLRSARLRSIELRRARFDSFLRGCATRSPKGEAWWSQTGSNRRPHACKARALPAELWPRTRRRMLTGLNQPAFANATARQPSFKRACRAEAAEQRRLVGLGRLELPTSRLSSARSNQLSYKPQTLFPKRIGNLLACSRLRAGWSAQAQPLARVRPRRKRNEDGEIPPMERNNPEIAGP